MFDPKILKTMMERYKGPKINHIALFKNNEGSIVAKVDGDHLSDKASA